MLKPNCVYARYLRINHNLSVGVYNNVPAKIYLFGEKIKSILSSKDIKDPKLKMYLVNLIDKINDSKKLSLIYDFIESNDGQQILFIYHIRCNSKLNQLKKFIGLIKLREK